MNMNLTLQLKLFHVMIFYIYHIVQTQDERKHEIAYQIVRNWQIWHVIGRFTATTKQVAIATR